ncbi:MAG: six-hairpin glycosidase [Planctomycetota bacterium]|nr:MAG: six-hairpin glycosidase [Planctomycetota bacterium]
MATWAVRLALGLAFPAILGVAAAPAEEAASVASDYPIAPVAATAVRLSDAFWRPRLETNRTATIPYCFQKCEETGRIENFKVAGGLSERRWVGGAGFNDSDVSKVIEGAAYSLMTHPDAKLEAYLDEIISYYAAAQEEDGYLYTLLTAREKAPPLDRVGCAPKNQRWDNLSQSHELYNLGHLYEAAFAHWQATGKTNLLDVATKSADLLVRHFGEDKFASTSGHEEIEIGLPKLYRATGKQQYLDLAKFFLDMRGRTSPAKPELWGPYHQDHVLATEQTEAVGHAVRAMYLYAAMADVAALTGDDRYIEALDRLWDDVAGTKLYLTGGVGARREGEAFGHPYELPNHSAYCETCAAIGNCLWNHRMFLLHGDAKYIDVLERSLYNCCLSGVTLDGKRFFYPNPLESRGEHARSEWFDCSCCPVNVCRFIPSVPGFAYAVRERDVFVNLFAEGRAELEIDGQKAAIQQQTRYPWDGKVRLTVEPAAEQQFTLKIRVPGWAVGKPVTSDLYRYDEGPAAAAPSFIVHSGEAREKVESKAELGYVSIERRWKAGDTVEFELPMPIRRVLANDKVEANRGRVALERGPLVYCIEHPDVPEGRVLNLVLDDQAELSTRFDEKLLGGVQVIEGDALSTRAEGRGEWREIWSTPVRFTAIPYYAWAHRGPGEMAVWIARTAEAATPLPAPTIANSSKATASAGAKDPLSALSDDRQPKDSRDKSGGIVHWWPNKGTAEWLQYEFARPHTVRVVEVYWFDDTGAGECRTPAEWKLLYRRDGQWRPVAQASAYGCQPDCYNRCEFEAVTTDALRLEVRLQEGWSAGVHEWRVQ